MTEPTPTPEAAPGTTVALGYPPFKGLGLDGVLLPPWRAGREFLDFAEVSFARENGILVVERKEPTGGARKVRILTSRPDNFPALDLVWNRLVDDAPDLDTCEVPKEVLEKAITSAYHESMPGVAEAAKSLAASSGIEVLEDGEGKSLQQAASEIQRSEDLLDNSGKGPVARLLNTMVSEGLRLRASDIHIEPREETVSVRYRIDGVLHERVVLPQTLREPLASRAKILGRLDIAERRLPQDGAIRVKVGEREIDLRLSTFPTKYGERVHLRLLDRTRERFDIEGLGLSAENLKRLKNLISLSHGILFVTGPTGSGKTTTLYASLQALNSPDLNIMTLEDPIEYRIAGISQAEINEKKGFTFARGLRSILRQDPDIVMVGEVRDRETAEIAIQSAMTGHLVFSTLHTNDAPGAVTRLLDLGAEPHLVASTLNAVIAQRLVRRVCADCKLPWRPSPAELSGLGFSEADLGKTPSLARGKGCEKCLGTGYFGRTAIFEILVIDDELKDLVHRKATAIEIRDLGRKKGMRTLREDGIHKALDGVTTLEEVRSATRMEVD